MARDRAGVDARRPSRLDDSRNPPDLGIAEVVVDLTGDPPVVRVCGEIDLYTRWVFEDALEECVGAAGREIVVDLEAVEFIDTGSLSLMGELARRLRADGRGLVLRRPRRFVLKLLEILALDQDLRIDPGEHHPA